MTKGKQWIKLNKSMELLDTPGILWPKFDDQNTGMKLAFIGSINDEIIIMEEMALDLIQFLKTKYPKALDERYDITIENLKNEEILALIGRQRGCIMKGDEVDYKRAANLLVDDFRSGRLGRITLEFSSDRREQHESK